MFLDQYHDEHPKAFNQQIYKKKVFKDTFHNFEKKKTFPIYKCKMFLGQ